VLCAYVQGGADPILGSFFDTAGGFGGIAVSLNCTVSCTGLHQLARQKPQTWLGSGQEELENKRVSVRPVQS